MSVCMTDGGNCVLGEYDGDDGSVCVVGCRRYSLCTLVNRVLNFRYTWSAGNSLDHLWQKYVSV